MFPGEGEPPLPEDAEVPVRIDIKVELLCPQHNPVSPSSHCLMNFFRMKGNLANFFSRR